MLAFSVFNAAHMGEVTPDELAPEFEGGSHNDERSCGRVDDEIAGFGGGRDQAGDQSDRLDVRVEFAIDLFRPTA